MPTLKFSKTWTCRRGAIVLVTEAINAELDGTRVEYSLTNFAADRMELDIDHSAGQFGL